MLLPEGCFEGIEEGCGDLDTSEYSCFNTEVSMKLALQAAEDLGVAFVSFLQDVVPGGIVDGVTLSQRQYDCSVFLSISDDSNQSGVTSESQTRISEDNYIDIPDGIDIVIEYGIVMLYIALSYAAATQAFSRYWVQGNRTFFKTRINLSLVCLFSVWVTGNLLYLVLYNSILSESNFFYVKMLLTSTYSITYSSFTMIVHVR